MAGENEDLPAQTDPQSGYDDELRRLFIPVPLGPEVNERMRRGLLDVQLFPPMPMPQKQKRQKRGEEEDE